MATTGDGAILAFDDPSDAHCFATVVPQPRNRTMPRVTKPPHSGGLALRLVNSTSGPDAAGAKRSPALSQQTR